MCCLVSHYLLFLKYNYDIVIRSVLQKFAEEMSKAPTATRTVEAEDGMDVDSTASTPAI